MVKFILKSSLLVLVLLGVAAAGVQINARDIDNDTLRTMASGWNSLAKNLHKLVVDHDDDVVDFSKKMAGKAGEGAASAMAKVGEYADDHKDDIRDLAKKAGEKFGKTISSDD